jgi:hypothetical protein
MIHLVDASGLAAFPQLVAPDDHLELWNGLTKAVEDQRLRLSYEVRDELNVIARQEPIAAWASGLGSVVRKTSTNIKYFRPLTALVRKNGYSEGFVTLDAREPSIVGVGKLALEYCEDGIEFRIISDDLGLHPLCPTMEQLCEFADWELVTPADGIRALGMESLLV